MNSSLRLPGLLVLASSALFAFLALILDAEAFWILEDWPPRQAFTKWLESENLLSLAQHGISQSLIFLSAMFCGLYGLWLGARRIEVRESGVVNHAKRWVLGVTAVALMVQLTVPPCWSSDVFLYGMHGEMVRVHEANPFTESGADFARHHVCPQDNECHSDFYAKRLSWSKHPVSYGPVAVGLFALAYQPGLVPHDNALVFRIWSALAAFIAVFWLMRLWGLRSAMFFGWSPVLYLSSGNGGHLEPFLVLSALGLITLLRNPRGFSGPALGALTAVIGLIKLPFVGLALPFAVAKARTIDLRKNLWIFACGTLLLLGGYWLMWGETHPFSGLMAESTKSMRSLLHLLRHALWGIFDSDPIQILRWMALVIVGAWAFLRLKSVDKEEDALKTTLLIWLIATAFVLGVFHPWHVLPAWALALGLKDRGGVYKAWLYLALVSPLLVYGSWVVLGKNSFAPWQSSLIALLLFVPAFYFITKGKQAAEV